MTLPAYFRLSKKISLNSDYRVKMGASIMVKGKTIAVGVNQRFKTHPLIRQYNDFQGIHAEVTAILSVKNKDNLKGATIVIYRESKDGTPALARPCKTCMKILRVYGISKMIYTNTEGYYTEEWCVKD